MKTKEAFMELRQMEAEEPNQLQETTRNVELISLVLNPNKLSDLNKASISALSSQVRYHIRQGLEDGLDALIFAKKLIKLGEDIVEKIKDDVYAKPYAVKGEILKRHSAEVEQCDVYSKWDYSNCGDVTLNNLLAQQEQLKERIENRQNELQIITTISEQVDPETAEIWFVNPPVKKSKLGYRINLK